MEERFRAPEAAILVQEERTKPEDHRKDSNHFCGTARDTLTAFRTLEEDPMVVEETSQLVDTEQATSVPIVEEYLTSYEMDASNIEEKEQLNIPTDDLAEYIRALKERNRALKVENLVYKEQNKLEDHHKKLKEYNEPPMSHLPRHPPLDPRNKLEIENIEKGTLTIQNTNMEISTGHQDYKKEAEKAPEQITLDKSHKHQVHIEVPTIQNASSEAVIVKQQTAAQPATIKPTNTNILKILTADLYICCGTLDSNESQQQKSKPDYVRHYIQEKTFKLHQTHLIRPRRNRKHTNNRHKKCNKYRARTGHTPKEQLLHKTRRCKNNKIFKSLYRDRGRSSPISRYKERIKNKHLKILSSIGSRRRGPAESNNLGYEPWSASTQHSKDE